MMRDLPDPEMIVMLAAMPRFMNLNSQDAVTAAFELWLASKKFVSEERAKLESKKVQS